MVAIVVDQLAAWIVDERLPTLPPSGGFARLAREGTWHKKMRFAHAMTDTSPGHAALHTGAPPRENGVWGNEIVDDGGAKLSLFRDPRTTVVVPQGIHVEPGTVSSSAIVLRKQTVADRLRAATPDAVILSLSLKDRSAITGGGRRPTAVLWFDRDLDTFATSTAYASVFPLWAVPVAGHEALVARRARPWAPLDPAWLERHAAGVPDDGPDEGDIPGFGTTFPHDLTTTKQAARAFRSSPYADEAVLALATTAIQRLARDDAPLYIALSLSANDYIGHLFGAASRESWDNFLRLDGELGRFFAFLDARYGKDGWSVVLTADHGATAVYQHRLIHADLAARAAGAAGRALGDGRWITAVADPYLFFTDAARALPADKQRVLVEAVKQELRAVPGVGDVIDAREAPASCPPDDDESIPALLCRSLPPTNELRLYILLADDAIFDPDLVIGKGGNHGSPREVDRTVPLFVRAPGRVAAGRVIEQPVSYRLFSETLAALLHL